jgi:hypothetical protein
LGGFIGFESFCLEINLNDFEKICTISPAGHSLTRRARRDFRSIRSIVPQELVFRKTYPFGMIKLIQQIFYLQFFIPFEKY